MKNEELKKILNSLPIPEPAEEAKEKAVGAALAEFHRQSERKKKKVKGSSWVERLMGKNRKGGSIMTRPIAIATAGIAVGCIALAITLSPVFVSEKARFSKPRAVQVASRSDLDETPQAPSTAVDIESQPKASGKEIGDEGTGSDSAPGRNLHDATTVTEVVTRPDRDETPRKPYRTGDLESELGDSAREVTAARPGDVQATTKSDLNKTPGVPSTTGNTETLISVTGHKIKKGEAAGSPAPALNFQDEFVLEEATVQASPPAMRREAKLNGRGMPAMALSVAKFPMEPGVRPPVDQTYVGRDKFDAIRANTVKLVSEAPVSTFSIDVDTASYAFVRRSLNNGHLPPENAVRIEELVNYFDYDYPLPGDRTAPFKPTVAVFPTPWNPDTRLLHIGIKGFDIAPAKKPKSNLVFLIDVSGSMQNQDKLPLLKNSFRMLVNSLEADDTVAIVVYAGAAGTVLEPTRVSERGKILAAIDRLEAGGSTAGGEGIAMAYSLAESGMDPDGVNRVILATDGDFNVGIRDPEVLKDFVSRKRKSGVYLSVLGFGQGNYNDALMQKLAQNGNGNAAYIDSLNEARKVLVDEASGTMFTIANDVKIQVEFNPAMVAEYRLIGYETRMLNREDFKNDAVDAGDIGSGHTVTAIYEITPTDSKAKLIDVLRYGDGEKTRAVKRSQTAEYAYLKMRYKLPGESSSREIATPIDKRNEYAKISDAPADSRFASAVAAFGQILRGDSYVRAYDCDEVIGLARGAKGDDAFGYRGEFINLVRLAQTAAAMGDR